MEEDKQDMDDLLFEDKFCRDILNAQGELERHCYEIGVKVDDYIDILKNLGRTPYLQRFYIRKLEDSIENDYED